MRAALVAPMMAGALFVLPSCSKGEAPALTDSYFAMRDARICAGLDPRTNADAMAREENRTEAILKFGRRNGVGRAIDAAEQHWIDTDGYGDKICPFQDVGELDEPILSLEIYQAANDALEAAIAAEAE